MPPCLLDFLTRPNAVPDSRNSAPGSVTTNALWEPASGIIDWSEFNYETLISCWGPVLQHPQSSFPRTEPPLGARELEIFNEDSLDHFLSRSIIAQVRFGLQVGWSIRYGQGHERAVDIGRGGRAKKNPGEVDARLFPDLAGTLLDQRTAAGGYRNLCPGETKLYTKWSSSERKADFLEPFSQIQSYCGRQWNVRYGYVIPQEELCVVRITKKDPGPGLVATKPSRNVSPPDYRTHKRPFSTETISSGLGPVSIDEASGYQDENPNVGFKPVEFKSIPWTNSGPQTMTVELALWWLHMMASVPDRDISVKACYPPLHSWVWKENRYEHISAGWTQIDKPQNGAILSPDTPEAPEASSTSAGTRSVPNKEKGKAAGKKKR